MNAMLVGCPTLLPTIITYNYLIHFYLLYLLKIFSTAILVQHILLKCRKRYAFLFYAGLCLQIQGVPKIPNRHAQAQQI